MFILVYILDSKNEGKLYVEYFVENEILKEVKLMYVSSESLIIIGINKENLRIGLLRRKVFVN